MGLSRDENQAVYQIQAYRPGSIQINGIIYTKSLIVSSQKLINNWNPQSIFTLNRKDLELIVELAPTILLIGTGSTQEFLPREMYGYLLNEGIGVEVMNTGAACRTFMALTAENRNVVAALII